MLLENFKPEWIRALNEVSKQLQNVTVRIPSFTEQQKAKDIIEQILPPEEGQVTMGYVRNVLIALEYARWHAKPGNSMMDDIISGEQISVPDYKYTLSES